MSGSAGVGWFGEGWLAGRTAVSGAELLALVWLGGVVLIWLSYRFSVSPLSAPRRAILAASRALLLAGLLLLLAAPAHLKRTFSHSPERRPLAVLVDRSASMTTPDNRGRRRIDDALAQWHDWMRADAKNFGPASTFAFAGGVVPVASAMTVPALSTGQTRLFDSLQWVLAHGPAGGWGGVVALTDGLDTETADIPEAVRQTTRQAVSAGTPLFFAVGHNRALGRPFVHLRQLEAPASVSPHSVAHLSAIFESFQLDDTAVPLRVTINGIPQPAVTLHLEPGRHLATWSLDYRAGQPGAIDFGLKAGAETGRAQVTVLPPASHRVLYLAGEFNWGYRGVAESLRRGREYQVSAVFPFPLPGVALPPGVLPPFPLDGTSLEPFGVAILENAAATRLTGGEQAALEAWVSHGGVLLFWISHPGVIPRLAGTALEDMLPVSAPPQGEAERSYAYPDLPPLAWASPEVVADLFGTDVADFLPATPRIAVSIATGAAKPAAQVLARTHPRDGQPGSILVAAQPYGEGRTALLAADGLWRWSLSQPGTSHGPEMFWQKLFGWLTRQQSAKEYFDQPPAETVVGQPMLLRVRHADQGNLRVAAQLGSRHVELAEHSAADGARVFEWQAPAAGLWRIAADTGKGDPVPIWIEARGAAADRGELSGAAPDEDLLRQLAAATGGAIIGQNEPSFAERPSPHLVATDRLPLWHRWWILAVLIGLYAFDLTLRRRWKLL